MIDAGTSGLPGWRGGENDAAYLDKTLRHHAVETALDDSVGWRTLLLLLVYGFFAQFVVFALFGVLGLLLALTGSFLVATTVFSIGGFLSLIAFWAATLLITFQEPVGEWRVLLADRGDTAAAVYSQINGTMTHRRVPLSFGSSRVRTGLGPEDVTNRIVVTRGAYLAYVSVFPYGTGLYLGWTMWRSRRGYQLIAQFMVDIALSVMGRLTPDRIMLRTEQPRAMREALHAACREGLTVAVERRAVPVEFGFPQGLPPVREDVRAAPVPIPPARHAQQNWDEPPPQAWTQQQQQPPQS